MFHFVKDIFTWFFSGSVEAPVVSTAVPEIEQPVVAEAKSSKVNVVEDIRSLGKRESFLSELRSIEPRGKKFNQAREDFLNEVKRLSPRTNQ